MFILTAAISYETSVYKIPPEVQNSDLKVCVGFSRFSFTFYPEKKRIRATR